MNKSIIDFIMNVYFIYNKAPDLNAYHLRPELAFC